MQTFDKNAVFSQLAYNAAL